MAINPWKTLSSEYVYQNPWIKVREDAVITPAGNRGTYGVVESRDSVIVGSVNDKNEVYLIYSFSYTSQTWNWELPGGGTEGKDTLSSSKRELAEETGLHAKKWIHIGTTRVCDGLMTEKMHTFIAKDIEFGDKPTADDSNAIIKGEFLSLEKIKIKILNGEINENQTIAAIYLIENHLELKPNKS